MTFATDAVAEGRGVAFYLDLSVDAFATTSYRWATHAGQLDGTNHYEARIVAVGAITRGLGVGRQVTSSTSDVVLDNTDGLLDWLLARAQQNTRGKLRMRLTLVIYDAAAGFTAGFYSSKQLGEWVLADWPRRNESTIRLSLSDDVMGTLSSTLLLPSLANWATKWNTDNSPEKLVPPRGLDMSRIIPLVFGHGWVESVAPAFAVQIASGRYRGVIPFRCGGNVPTTSLVEFVMQTRPGEPMAVADRSLIPSGWSFSYGADLALLNSTAVHDEDSDGDLEALTRWELQNTTVTLNTLTFNVTCVVIYPTTLFFDLVSVPGVRADQAGLVTSIDDLYDLYGSGTIGPNANGWVGAGQLPESTPPTVPAGGLAAAFNELGLHGLLARRKFYARFPSQSGTSAAEALLTDYLKPTRTVDATSYAAVDLVRRDAYVFGSVEGSPNSGPLAVYGRSGSEARAVLSGICGSCDFDIFQRWDGAFGFAADTFAALGGVTSGLIAFSETEIDRVEDWIPNANERGAAGNMHMATGSAPDALLPPSRATEPTVSVVSSIGVWPPGYSNATPGESVDPAFRSVLVTYDARWRQRAGTQGTRELRTRAVSRVRFTTGLKGLLLELGDYFTLTWTRGTVSVYAGDVFQCESLRFDPSTCTVLVEGLWRSDSGEPQPYILDKQSFAVRLSPGGNLSVTDGDGTVTFASGGLTAAGVAAGDILVLTDSSQAALIFTRYRALRILSVTSDSVLEVETGDLDFDAAAPTAVASWEIRRGATTYPSLSGANYPNGGGLYGKVADTPFDGTYSDASEAHRLVGG